MAATRWKRRFDDPIPLPRGRQLLTLQDAADYILKLPKAEQNVVVWRIAIRCLIDAAEGRNFIMHARIGMLRALNHGQPVATEPRRKRAKTRGEHHDQDDQKRALFNHHNIA